MEHVVNIQVRNLVPFNSMRVLSIAYDVFSITSPSNHRTLVLTRVLFFIESISSIFQ